MNVFCPQGIPMALNERIGGGAEGDIYTLISRPDLLVKQYHPDYLQKNGPMIHPKIQLMCRYKPLFADQRISWPLLPVFNEHQQQVGYAMKRFHGHAMQLMANKQLYPVYFPGLNRKELLNYLAQYIELVQMLHSNGVMIGDFNLNNVLCDPNTGQLAIVDTDSFQLQCPDRLFPCPVGSPDITPLEHHNKRFADIVRNPASESFSLGMMLFMALMLGRHPYDRIEGEDRLTNLKQGLFAYGKGNTGIPLGDWYNIWSHMPYRLKSLFITTFTSGAAEPAERPRIKDWLEAIQLYRKELDKGFYNPDLIPDSPKTSDYKGNARIA